MNAMTEAEWSNIQAALVVGGLRECIDEMLLDRAGTNELGITDANRLILCRAYDDGDGNTVALEKSEIPGYFEGLYGGNVMMEGTQIDGVLYSICTSSGGGGCEVLVGTEIVDNVVGPSFHNFGEARAYIRGLTAK